MLWRLRRYARLALRPLLASAALLWLATVFATCFNSVPHCDGMDGAMPCAHASTLSDCDSACLKGVSHGLIAADFDFRAVAPVLLAVAAALVVRWPTTRTASAPARRRRAADTPLRLKFARLLI